MIDKFQTFPGLPLFFQSNYRTFQFSEIQGLFKAGLEFKAGAGTLNHTLGIWLDLEWLEKEGRFDIS